MYFIVTNNVGNIFDRFDMTGLSKHLDVFVGQREMSALKAQDRYRTQNNQDIGVSQSLESWLSVA